MSITVGLDIGSRAVRAAVVEITRSGPILRRFGEMPLAPGLIDLGDVVDEAGVTEAVAALWKRLRLPRKRVVVGIANQRVIVRQVDVPYLEETELREALPYQVQDAIPIPVEEAVLDFVPLEEYATPEGDPMLSILVVAAQRDMVEGLVRIASGAGLSVLSIDLQAFGLVRAAFGANLLGGGPLPQAVLDIGASMSQVAIVRSGITRFVRIIPTGGDHFTELLMSEMALGREEAEELKRTVGVAAQGSPGGEDASAVANRILTRGADALIEEIRGSLNYYLTQAGEHALERLVVSGNGARLPHLANRVARSLNTRVEPVRVLDHLRVGRLHMTEAELLAMQPVLPAAVGLGLWGSYVVLPTDRFPEVA